MVSEEQLKANQVNALKSTGAKTEEGKEIAKLNALKHGLLSKEVLLYGENAQTLEQLGKDLRKQLQPVGQLELILVDRITSSVWRLKRALTVESAAMTYQNLTSKSRRSFDFDEFDFSLEIKPAEGKEIQKARQLIRMIANDDMEKITRYEKAIEKQFYKAIHELVRLQAMRLGKQGLAPLAVDVEIN